MATTKNKIYIGFDAKQTYTNDEPQLIIATIDEDFDECLFKTAWALESQGVISEEDAKNMDINLADELDIHILGLNIETAKAIGRAVNNIKN